MVFTAWFRIVTSLIISIKTEEKQVTPEKPFLKGNQINSWFQIFITIWLATYYQI